MSQLERFNFTVLTRRDYLTGGAITLVLFVALLVPAMTRVNHLLLGYDMAYFSQVSWLISHGESPFSTLRGLHILGDHANYIMWPVAYATRLVPAHILLPILQSAALALGAFFIYLLTRRIARRSRSIAAGLAVSYGLFPALHNLNVADFHPDSFAVSTLIAAVYFAVNRKWVAYGICVAIALSCREDIAIAVALLGAVLIITQRRRAGLITIACAGLLLAINLGIVMPHFGGDNYEQAGKFGQFGSSLTDIAINIIKHPRSVAAHLFDGDNLLTLTILFAPVLFFPFLAFRWLIPGLPLQVLYMLSTVEAAHTTRFHYNAVVTAFIFVAVAMALRQAQWSQRLPVAFLLAGSLFWWSYGLDAELLIKKPTSYGSLERSVEEAAALAKPGDAVFASDRMWQRMYERKDLYSAAYMMSGEYKPPKDPVPFAERMKSIDFVAIDTVDQWQWNKPFNEPFLLFLDQGHWVEVFNRDGIIAYRAVR